MHTRAHNPMWGEHPFGLLQHIFSRALQYGPDVMDSVVIMGELDDDPTRDKPDQHRLSLAYIHYSCHLTIKVQSPSSGRPSQERGFALLILGKTRVNPRIIAPAIYVVYNVTMGLPSNSGYVSWGETWPYRKELPCLETSEVRADAPATGNWPAAKQAVSERARRGREQRPPSIFKPCQWAQARRKQNRQISQSDEAKTGRRSRLVMCVRRRPRWPIIACLVSV